LKVVVEEEGAVEEGKGKVKDIHKSSNFKAWPKKSFAIFTRVWFLGNTQGTNTLREILTSSPSHAHRIEHALLPTHTQQKVFPPLSYCPKTIYL